MSTETITSDLEEFHRYVGKQLQNGGAELTPEEVLAMWRDREATIAAVKEGLDDLQAGRVTPFEEFDREFRKKHGMAPPA